MLKYIKKSLSLTIALMLVVGMFAFAPQTAKAAATYTTGDTAQQLVDALVQSGVTITNPVVSGDSQAYGIFSGWSGGVGMPSGIMLNTGKISEFFGANDNTCLSTDHSVQGTIEPNLQSLTPGQLQDCSYLSFDVTPKGDTIKLEFCFASEEYNERVGATNAAVCGIFLEGWDPVTMVSETRNIALVPGTGFSAGINTINNGSYDSNTYSTPTSLAYSMYFNDNDNQTGAAPYDTQMDGITDVITAEGGVVPNAPYKVIIAIADTGNGDANLLIRSISSPHPQMQFPAASYTADVSAGMAAITVTRTGQTDIPCSVDYATSNGTAVAGTNYTSASGTLAFSANETAKTFNVATGSNSSDIGKTISLTLSNPINGTLGTQSTAVLTIVNNQPPPPPIYTGGGYYPPPPLPVVPKTAFPCDGEVVGKRIGVFKLESLKTRLFYLNRGEEFTILGLANGGRAFQIEHDGRQGFVEFRDISATFGAPIKATAIKKGYVYIKQENGKLKRDGYFPKDTVLTIYGISGKYLENKRSNITYWLDAAQWKLWVPEN